MIGHKPGYKRPPRATQFKPGKSGNPKGRPKGARNFKSDLKDELCEVIRIKEQGHSKTITKQRALIKSLTAKAVQGDTRAANTLINVMFRLRPPELIDEMPTELSEEDQAILDTYVVRRRFQDTPQEQAADDTAKEPKDK
jgi:hypothetical protein